VTYKNTDYYAPEHERGVAWDDPDLAVSWPVDRQRAVLSDRDRRNPRLRDIASYFAYETSKSGACASS
jgi:dTDP-4-dehydrorhamnose 3,5-epimerase